MWTTPFTLVMGPVLPLIPLPASNRIIPNTTISDTMLALFTDVDNCARCTEEAMKNNIGNENSVLVREARPALASAPAAAGSASPPAAAFSAEAITIFWLGQMISQTFRNIIVPRVAPTIMP